MVDVEDPKSPVGQFNSLLHFIQKNGFRLVIVEGPRGCGKTTFCTRLLEMTDLVYYKTWGSEQKWIRHEMSKKLNLDLPQGTYFVLDFLAQVPTLHPILADRGHLSAMAYQRVLPWGFNEELHKYYTSLMRQVGAVMLVLDGPPEVILERRISRGDADEQYLARMDRDTAARMVKNDIALYEDAVNHVLDLGLDEVYEIDLAEGCSCSCLVPEEVELTFLPE